MSKNLKDCWIFGVKYEKTLFLEHFTVSSEIKNIKYLESNLLIIKPGEKY